MPWITNTVMVDSRPRRPAILKITDDIYCAHNYAFANAFFVVTSNSVIVIDTTESVPAARAMLDDFRQFCRFPISYVIYTHHHGDHTLAAKVFCTPTTKVIAQKLLPDEIARRHLLFPYYRRMTNHQFASAPGATATASGPGHMAIEPEEIEPGYIPPHIVFDSKYFFEEGGISIQVFHMPGETVDQAVVWLPDKRVLFPADLFYLAFPMLSSPMRQDRPVAKWADSIDSLRALGAEHLAPSAGKPVTGAVEISEMLANYAKAIRYVHDSTVRCINTGKTVEEAVQQIKLPKELAQIPYLRQRYGKVSWAIRGLYRQYTGWYPFNPTELNPRPNALRHRTLVNVCGGIDPIILRAERAWEDKDWQLVLELSEIVLSAQADDARALELRLAALQRLASVSRNPVERNLYRRAATELAMHPHSVTEVRRLVERR